MAIKELITLEGVEEVEASLKKLQTTGEQSLKSFRDLGSTGQAFTPLANAAKDAGAAVDQLGGHSQRLSEIFHILRPALQAAGVQIGEFGSLARIAGAGLGALAVAAAGAVVVALARLEEAAAATKGRLTDLFGTQAAGERAFNQLKQGVAGLGTNAEKLAPALEAAKTALDRFIATSSTVKFVALPGVDLPTGTAQNLKNIGDAVLNFFKLLRAGRLDADEAAKADKAFFDTLKEGGLVTAAALKNLPTGTVQLLAEAMGRGKISAEQFIAEVALAPVPVNKLIEALARFSPQAQEAFDQKAIKGFGDAFNELLKVLQEGFKGISGTTFSDVIVQNLNRISQGIKDTTREFEALAGLIKRIEDLTQSDLMGKFVQTLREGITGAGAAGGAFGGTTEEISAIWGAAGISAADRFTQAFKNTPQAIEQIFSTTVTDIQSAQQTQWQSIFDGVVSTAQSAFDRIVSIFSQPIPVNFQGFGNQPQGAPFASGGMVRGRGTTTSDSILAWLSNKEFVVNARAVSHYGPDLFAALNAMRLPRDFVSRFSMGGLARAISGNKFAAGGQVRAGNPVVLKIDRQSFNMTAGDDVIGSLKRFAVASQLSSTGRKPRWVK